MPSELGRDPAGKARLDVDPTERLLGVVHPRLDLDHAQRASWLVPGEDVNSTAISVVVEAHLDAHIPAEVLEQLDEPVLKGRGYRRLTPEYGNATVSRD